MKRDTAGFKQKKETQVVQQMIALYCRGRHKMPKGQLCPDCLALAEYAAQRVAHCPHKETKTFCSNCKTHCYQPRENPPGDALFRPAHAAASPGDGGAAYGGNYPREKKTEGEWLT